MWETWVQSLGWEDPLEKGKATHSSILAWRIPWTIQSMGCKELDTTKRLSLSPLMVLKLLILKIKTFKTFPLFDFIELFILSQVYEEAGSDFHQVAYFKTRIGLRNALREEISGSSDREAVLITLNRPIVYAQPVAFDRGKMKSINTTLSDLKMFQ